MGWLILDVAAALLVAAFAEAITAAWPGSAMARLTRPIASRWSAGRRRGSFPSLSAPAFGPQTRAFALVRLGGLAAS